MAEENTTAITDSEFIAMQQCLICGDREMQLADNLSEGGYKEIMKALCWNRQQVSALIGSLESKGLAEIGVNLVWLTVKGINVFFDEEERRANEPVKTVLIESDSDIFGVFKLTVNGRKTMVSPDLEMVAQAALSWISGMVST